MFQKKAKVLKKIKKCSDKELNDIRSKKLVKHQLSNLKNQEIDDVEKEKSILAKAKEEEEALKLQIKKHKS